MAVTYRAVSSTAGASSASCVVTKPTGTVTGDMMVVEINNANSTGPNGVPSGWTLLIDDTTGGSYHHLVYWKICEASEPASWTWTWASGVFKGAICVSCYSSTAAALKIDTSNTGLNASSTNRVWPTVTTTVANTLLLMFCQFIGAAPSTTPPGGSTEIVDGGASVRLYAMVEAFVGPGATGTRTGTGSSATSQTAIVVVAEISTINGAAALTVGAVAVSAMGNVPVKGDASLTVGAVTLSAGGNVPIAGAADLTLAAITLSAAAKVIVQAAAAVAVEAITLVAAGLLPPPAPTLLEATPITASRIDLSWEYEGQTIDGFAVERSPNGTTGWTVVDTLDADARGFSDLGLADNTHFYYRIRAFRS